MRTALMSRGKGCREIFSPIVEGTTVTTKHGPVKTDHILFIAAGAFHMSKPSDLLSRSFRGDSLSVSTGSAWKRRVHQDTHRAL